MENKAGVGTLIQTSHACANLQTSAKQTDYKAVEQSRKRPIHRRDVPTAEASKQTSKQGGKLAGRKAGKEGRQEGRQGRSEGRKDGKAKGRYGRKKEKKYERKQISKTGNDTRKQRTDTSARKQEGKAFAHTAIVPCPGLWWPGLA